MTRISVPDMSCGHCRASVEAALSALPGVTGITFDQEARQVEVGGDASPQALVAALDAVGFPARVGA